MSETEKVPLDAIDNINYCINNLYSQVNRITDSMDRISNSVSLLREDIIALNERVSHIASRMVVKYEEGKGEDCAQLFSLYSTE